MTYSPRADPVGQPPGVAVTDTMPEGWSDLFVANAGVAGAPAGLIIGAISVKVATILTIHGMTSRAGATIASLVLIVVSATPR